MKKIITFALGAVVTVAAAAQSWQDALYFSENLYQGTARSVGMGNALTAVGGDLGSIGLNPAGSSVAGYSQVVITPGLSISSTSATGVIPEGSTSPMGLGDKVNSGYARVKLPNIGFIINADTGRRAGWKRFSFGMVSNATNDFTGRVVGSGVNEDNSFAASLASSAEGYTENVLGTGDWWYDGPDVTRMPAWMDMVGYRSGMFNGIPGSANKYQAVTEVRDAANNCWLAAPVYQKYGQQTYGYKQDLFLNMSANYNDQLYLGFNLGFTMLNYNMSEYWQESPENAEGFPDIEYTDGTRGRFASLMMKHNYSLRGSGVYFKAGLLWRPVGGLRLGVAIQSPTWTNMRARQAYSGEVRLTGKTLLPSTSPEDDWTFRLQQPWRLNAGVAYSFGSVAVVSADYELTDYRSARYRGSSASMPAYLTDANGDIQNALTVGHQFRAGLEVKPASFLSIRAGYNYITSAQKNWLNADWTNTPLSSAERIRQAKHVASVGLGASFGAFFVDAAVRVRFMPKEYLLAYDYYTYESDPMSKRIDNSVLTPELEAKARLWDALLTFGWRF